MTSLLLSSSPAAGEEPGFQETGAQLPAPGSDGLLEPPRGSHRWWGPTKGIPGELLVGQHPPAGVGDPTAPLALWRQQDPLWGHLQGVKQGVTPETPRCPNGEGGPLTKPSPCFVSFRFFRSFAVFAVPCF